MASTGREAVMCCRQDAGEELMADCCGVCPAGWQSDWHSLPGSDKDTEGSFVSCSEPRGAMWVVPGEPAWGMRQW